MMELTPGDVQEILKVFVESDLQELQLQVGDVTLQVSKNEASPPPVVNTQPSRAVTPTPATPTSPVAAVQGPVAEEIAAPPDRSSDGHGDRANLHPLRSPSVGVFYRRPGPDEPPYVEIGDVVQVGDPVCTISVMKMFTQIGADRGGRIVDVCVENETLVEHGQVLMYIEPLDES